jgi:hypothetical protein
MVLLFAVLAQILTTKLASALPALFLHIEYWTKNARDHWYSLGSDNSKEKGVGK